MNTDIPAKKQRIIGRPFPKGVSGNPAGKPKGTFSFTTLIKRRLQELRTEGRTVGEIMADNIIQDALDSSNEMRKLIWNYVDGLPKQTIGLGQADDLEPLGLFDYARRSDNGNQQNKSTDE